MQLTDKITYTVCAAPDPVTVPKDLIGNTASSAEARLRELGLIPETRSVDDAAKKDEVLEVEKAGEKVDPGTEITLTVSNGELVEVPDGASLDGGDVLKVGSTVYVGLGGRTDAGGLDAVRSAFEPVGATVVGVPVTKVLHLKSAVTALPDGTVVGFPPLVDDPAVFPEFRAVPEEAGSHVVLLGDGALLMAASAPRSAELFTGLGYRPVVVDISEYEKLEGCVTCLSVRLRHSPA